MTDAMSYAEWVRRTLARARASSGRVTALFDSAVPEPTVLLADTIARAFAPPLTDRYVSAFSGGNRFVVEQLARRYRVGADRIVCTTGATGALSLVCEALVGAGGRIAIETPGFDLFGGIAARLGIPADRFARRAHDFALDLDALDAALTPATRLVVLSNLHNPSSALIPRETIARLAALAQARGFLVLFDEVYGDYADAALRGPPAVAVSPRFVSVSSLTKIFGLSTLRCGWIVGDPAVVAPVRALADRYEFGISNLAHAVAALVLEDDAPFMDRTERVLAAARPIAAAAFEAWRRDGLIAGDLPAFGCIAFPRLPGIEDTAAFAEWLGERCGVLVAPGEFFGRAGHVRIGFALPPGDLSYALDALGDGLRAYRANLRRRTA